MGGFKYFWGIENVACTHAGDFNKKYFWLRFSARSFFFKIFEQVIDQ